MELRDEVGKSRRAFPSAVPASASAERSIRKCSYHGRDRPASLDAILAWARRPSGAMIDTHPPDRGTALSSTRTSGLRIGMRASSKSASTGVTSSSFPAACASNPDRSQTARARSAASSVRSRHQLRPWSHPANRAAAEQTRYRPPLGSAHSFYSIVVAPQRHFTRSRKRFLTSRAFAPARPSAIGARGSRYGSRAGGRWRGIIRERAPRAAGGAPASRLHVWNSPITARSARTLTTQEGRQPLPVANGGLGVRLPDNDGAFVALDTPALIRSMKRGCRGPHSATDCRDLSQSGTSLLGPPLLDQPPECCQRAHGQVAPPPLRGDTDVSDDVVVADAGRDGPLNGNSCLSPEVDHPSAAPAGTCGYRLRATGSDRP